MKLPSLSLFLIPLLSVIASPAEATGSSRFDVGAAAEKIDALINKALRENEVKPNEPIDDATFVRRVYLDIIGRVPTIEEAEAFHASKSKSKREDLIADLLASDGHVSHSYNFWADVLRINSSLGTGARAAEAAYQLFVKDAVKENKPYDEFANELISATGSIWDNGAVGYYLRDRGMPLDNMSNTVRVFLGTRLECAQCHNHPFDVWTQKDYFQMAAFSYGMDANRYDSPNRDAFFKHQRDKRGEFVSKKVGIENFPLITNEGNLKRQLNNRNFDRQLERLGMTKQQYVAAAKRSIEAYESFQHDRQASRDALRQLYNPVRYIQTNEEEKTLKLPHDYQYDDAKPHDPVEPRTMFGAEIDLESIDEGAIQVYADWMTSPENPTFTRVIANRLWKRVFGHGVFEPVDELSENTPISNPELLDYLEKMMRELDYDMRRYQQVLFNTRAYQRASHAEEVIAGMPYYFPGPILRRMTAEQIWDSIVALALPEADGYRPRLKSQLAEVEEARQIYEKLEERPAEEYITMVEEVSDAFRKIRPKEEAVREKMYKARDAENEERYRELRDQLNELRRESRQVVSEIAYRNIGEKVKGENLLAAMGMSEMTMTADQMGSSMNMSMMAGAGERVVLTEMPKPEMPEPPAEIKEDKKKLKAWRDRQRNELRTYNRLVAEMARASELQSPAPRGHFLREFGQSDREVIENASIHASVPQALNLLNGSIVEALTNPYAVFGHRIHTAGDAEEKMRMIFQAMLTREPTEREMKIALDEIETFGDQAYEGVVWALLNTQQFIFVQ